MGRKLLEPFRNFLPAIKVLPELNEVSSGPAVEEPTDDDDGDDHHRRSLSDDDGEPTASILCGSTSFLDEP